MDATVARVRIIIKMEDKEAGGRGALSSITPYPRFMILSVKHECGLGPCLLSLLCAAAMDIHARGMALYTKTEMPRYTRTQSR